MSPYLADTCYCRSFLLYHPTCIKRYLIVVVTNNVYFTNNAVEHLFTCLLNIYIYSLQKCSNFYLFLTGLFDYCKSLCFLNSRFSSHVRLVIIFFHSVGCLSTFLGAYLEAQKFLILVTFNLFIFTLVACAFGVIVKKPVSNPSS